MSHSCDSNGTGTGFTVGVSKTHLPEREVLTAAGPIAVKVPKGTIISIYRIAFIIALSIEALGWGVVAVRKYGQGGNQTKRHL